MKDPAPLPVTETFGAMPLRGAAAWRRFRDSVLLAMVLCAAARCPGAFAADEAFSVNFNADPFGTSARDPRLRGAWMTPSGPWAPPAPFDLSAPPNPSYSPTEFRPRKPTLFDADIPGSKSYLSTPLLRSTTVWQRLSEYRSRDRVRLLTLWETQGSSVSLQAGKRGDPSLQWSSRIMNRGGATRGLFDQLLSVSFGSGGGHFKNTARPLGSVAPANPPIPTLVTSALK